MNVEAPSFGALAPSPRQERFRRLGHRLPANYWGRRAASLLLGPAGGRSRRAYDVTLFGGAKARLHPYDNICEKRVYLTPQLWDMQERSALASFIDATADDNFHFADVGANAGLYTLFARTAAIAAGKRFHGWCVEPDPVMLARLAFNLAASRAAGDVTMLPFAAAGESGAVHLSVNEQSRGLSRLAADGGLKVDARPLAALLADAPRLDAMKIDIEGFEYPALEAFFRDAPPARWPHLIIMEVSHEEKGSSASALVTSRGYDVSLQTRMNAVLRRQPA